MVVVVVLVAVAEVAVIAVAEVVVGTLVGAFEEEAGEEVAA